MSLKLFSTALCNDLNDTEEGIQGCQYAPVASEICQLSLTLLPAGFGWQLFHMKREMNDSKVNYLLSLISNILLN